MVHAGVLAYLPTQQLAAGCVGEQSYGRARFLKVAVLLADRRGMARVRKQATVLQGRPDLELKEAAAVRAYRRNARAQSQVRLCPW